jgi:hypothetical protein
VDLLRQERFARDAIETALRLIEAARLALCDAL